MRIALIAFAALSWLAPVATVRASDLLAVSEIAPGSFVHYGSLEERSPANLADNANIGFVIGERCVAAIDTGGSAQLGRRLRQTIAAHTKLPVCYVIITHAHPDHFFGATAFRADRPEYVGHAELPAVLRQRGQFYVNTLQRDLGDTAAGSEVVMPTLLVQDRVELDLGNRKLVLRAWPVGHTNNDLTVYDASTRTLWAADLLFLQHTPVIDGSLPGFLAVIEQLKREPVERYVAGHGRSDLAWPQCFEPEQRYLSIVLDETRRALKNRKTIQEAVETVGLSEDKAWSNFEQFHRRNVTAAYTELEWEE